MKGFGFLSVAGLIACLSTSAFAAAPRVIKCTGTFSFSAQTSNISFDGQAYASSLTGTGKNKCNYVSSLYTQQGVAETVFGDSPCTFTGPNGTTETGILGTEVAGYSIVTNSATGDLSFGQDVSGSTCFNETTTDYASDGSALIIGGTGANKGTTGTATSHSVGSGLFVASPSSYGFGFFDWGTGTATSTITVP